MSLAELREVVRQHWVGDGTLDSIIRLVGSELGLDRYLCRYL